MWFIFVCIIQIVWLGIACAHVYSKEKVDPWEFLLAVLAATMYAIPAAAKFSFGG